MMIDYPQLILLQTVSQSFRRELSPHFTDNLWPIQSTIFQMPCHAMYVLVAINSLDRLRFNRSKKWVYCHRTWQIVEVSKLTSVMRWKVENGKEVFFSRMPWQFFPWQFFWCVFQWVTWQGESIGPVAAWRRLRILTSSAQSPAQLPGRTVGPLVQRKSGLVQAAESSDIRKHITTSLQIGTRNTHRNISVTNFWFNMYFWYPQLKKHNLNIISYNLESVLFCTYFDAEMSWNVWLLLCFLLPGASLGSLRRVMLRPMASTESTAGRWRSGLSGFGGRFHGDIMGISWGYRMIWLIWIWI